MLEPNLAGMTAEAYIEALKAELAATARTDKAAIKAEISRILGDVKETADAPKNTEIA